MIHVAICDDEIHMSDIVRMLVSDFFRRKNMEISVFQFSGGKELLDYDGKIDILFLDIRMKDMDGMEAARELRNRKFRGFLIFITVLKEMVFRSFEVQAYDYLVKPVEKRFLEKTMERILVSMRCDTKENLLVQKGYESTLLAYSDTVFFEVIDRKIYAHLTSSEVIDFYGRIEELEKKLDSRFFRCHRSFLINLQHLRGYKSRTAYMENGEEIPVSRLRGKAFSAAVLQYMEEWRL